MFIDSHCHLDKLNLALYNHSFDTLLTETQERDIERMLCVSIDLQNFPAMYQLIEKYPQIDASLGVHPLHLKKEEDVPSIDLLVQLATEREKVVAIGETGLDYYYDKESKALQWQSFIHHLEAATILKQPVIIHTRDAREDTLELINKHGGEYGGVLHCFTESLEMAKKALDFNYMISFSGIVTFKNAAVLRDVVKALPLDRILIETDSPYLAPMPYRGKENQPKYVVEVAQCIADLKGITIAELASITRENYFRLFKGNILDQ